MPRDPNSQYNLASPDSLAIRVANEARFAMYRTFERTFQATEMDLVLDVGVTSDDQYASSNYLEALYPHKQNITAAGVDDATFLETKYPGLKFVHASALDLPFENQSFDYVHSSAVLEHVGSYDNQRQMIAECARVARKGIFLTTPNRWFPIEFHTQLPLVHWLPKSTFRRIMKATGREFFSREENLNLMTRRDLLKASTPISGQYESDVKSARLAGWPSNLLLIGRRRT